MATSKQVQRTRITLKSQATNPAMLFSPNVGVRVSSEEWEENPSNRNGEGEPNDQLFQKTLQNMYTWNEEGNMTI